MPLQVTKRMGTPADGGFDADRVIGAVLASATASATQADKATESAPVAPITPPKEEAAESKPEVGVCICISTSYLVSCPKNADATDSTFLSSERPCEVYSIH
jgi:hypothetical protein